MVCTVAACDVATSHHHHRVDGVRRDEACTCPAVTYRVVSGWDAADGPAL